MNKYVKGALLFTSGVAVGYKGTILLMKRFIRSEKCKELCKEMVDEWFDKEIIPALRDRREVYKFENLYFPTFIFAEVILKNMQDILKIHKVISVADFYNLAEHDPINGFKDRHYGWTNLDDVTIKCDHCGYYLTLPKPKNLD